MELNIPSPWRNVSGKVYPQCRSCFVDKALQVLEPQPKTDLHNICAYNICAYKHLSAWSQLVRWLLRSLKNDYHVENTSAHLAPPLCLWEESAQPLVEASPGRVNGCLHRWCTWVEQLGRFATDKSKWRTNTAHGEGAMMGLKQKKQTSIGFYHYCWSLSPNCYNPYIAYSTMNLKGTSGDALIEAVYLVALNMWSPVLTRSKLATNRDFMWAIFGTAPEVVASALGMALVALRWNQWLQVKLRSPSGLQGEAQRNSSTMNGYIWLIYDYYCSMFIYIYMINYGYNYWLMMVKIIVNDFISYYMAVYTRANIWMDMDG